MIATDSAAVVGSLKVRNWPLPERWVSGKRKRERERAKETGGVKRTSAVDSKGERERERERES